MFTLNVRLHRRVYIYIYNETRNLRRCKNVISKTRRVQRRRKLLSGRRLSSTLTGSRLANTRVRTSETDDRSNSVVNTKTKRRDRLTPGELRGPTDFRVYLLKRPAVVPGTVRKSCAPETNTSRRFFAGIDISVVSYRNVRRRPATRQNVARFLRVNANFGNPEPSPDSVSEIYNNLFAARISMLECSRRTIKVYRPYSDKRFRVTMFDRRTFGDRSR